MLLTIWRRSWERLAARFGSPSLSLIKRLLTDQGARHWKGYALSFGMMGLVAASTALSAWIIGRIINQVFVDKNLAAVWGISAAIVAIYTVKGLATYGQQVTMSRIANGIVADIQRRIFDQMLRMKVAYYSNSHSTEFIARQSFIGSSASTALNLVITAIARDFMTVIGLVVVMVSQDPLMSAIALVSVPAAALVVRRIGMRMRKIMANEFGGAMAMMESLQETAQGIRIVKAFTLEPFMRARQGRAIDSFQRAANRLSAVGSRTSPLMESLGGFAIAGVVLYGGLRVIVGGRDPGSLFSFITSVLMIYEPMKRLAKVQVDLNSSLFGVSMLYDFLDQGDHEADEAGLPELEVTAGRLEFRNVTFGYRREEPVLRGDRLRRRARQDHRAGRPLGRRQVDDHEPYPALLRRRGGRNPDRRRQPRQGQARLAARPDRLRQPGELPVQGLGARQHRDGPSRRERRGDRRRRQGRLRPRLHRRLRARLRFAVRREWPATVGRPAPAHRHRPRLPQRRADHSARRGDLGARTRNPSRRSNWRCTPYAPDGRPSSSPIACRPSPTPTRFASSSAAGWSSAATTPS